MSLDEAESANSVDIWRCRYGCTAWKLAAIDASGCVAFMLGIQKIFSA